MLEKFVNEDIATDLCPFIDNLIICLAPVQPQPSHKAASECIVPKKRQFCHYTIYHF